MALSADAVFPAVITTAAAMAAMAAVVVRAWKARMVPLVMVVDRNGRVHQLPVDDPRISSRL